MADELINIQEENGTITFADEVLETIAGIAVADIPGIANMKGGWVDSLSEGIGKKRHGKGVNVSKTNDKIIFDVQIVVEYGIKVQELCKTIQEAVFNAIQSMTGLTVSKVNISVTGVKVKEVKLAELTEGSEEEED